MSFKPMLASEADLAKLKFPLLASPKYDGIRCIVHPELGAVSRNLKPIPNAHIRALLNEFAQGLDGEIVVGDPTAKDCFQRTTSAVMSREGTPEFTFWAFDAPWAPRGFNFRLCQAGDVCRSAGPPWLKLVPHTDVHDLEELSAYEADRVAEGWEGVMLRDPAGIYKQGRSTVREGGLLKLKRFKDAEAIVVSVEEQLANENEATVDALGHTQRSSHKANLRPKGTLGALVVERFYKPHYGDGNATPQRFTIGTGFTQAQRDVFWACRPELIGKIVKFKYQECGTKDLPRFPVFLGFRDPGDM